MSGDRGLFCLSRLRLRCHINRGLGRFRYGHVLCSSHQRVRHAGWACGCQLHGRGADRSGTHLHGRVFLGRRYLTGALCLNRPTPQTPHRYRPAVRACKPYAPAPAAVPTGRASRISNSSSDFRRGAYLIRRGTYLETSHRTIKRKGKAQQNDLYRPMSPARAGPRSINDL